MKTQRNILIAFLLNLFFAVFELVGGIWTGSVAILSDAVHDLGDAAGIGISWLLERKSRREPDEHYTYGYGRYSVLGSLITTTILLAGSAAVIYNAVSRIITPTAIHYNGMIAFAVVGVAVNLIAAFVTREGDSLNQKAVNLHMLEDVLGWAVVLVGAIVMRMTDFALLDPLLSIAVAVFILTHAMGNLREGVCLLMEKVPEAVCLQEIRQHILAIDGVTDVHHLHVWSLDDRHNCATMHLVTSADPHQIKAAVRAELREHGIGHATLELEVEGEQCGEPCCVVEDSGVGHHHHHHHH